MLQSRFPQRWLGLGALLLCAGGLSASEDPSNSGHTAWMITASALVLFMTLPGLALFYGGLVRSKNILSVLMQCFALAGVMSILWMIYGYSVAFAGGNAFFGGLDNLFLGHLYGNVDGDGNPIDPRHVGGDVPETIGIMFQMTFAIITPALIVGAFAERMKFAAVLIFSVIWFTFSYAPICHMAWYGGDDAANIPAGLFWQWGVLDFAGGTVVHINAGIAALVACIMVGKRTGYPEEPMKPHSLVLTAIGTGMLWVGWFGFNAGSAVAANGSAGMAMLVTQIATAAAVVTWIAIEWIKHGKPSLLGAATGAVAGLVAITPASGSCGPMGALLIGFASSVVCYLCATSLKKKLGYDDSLDVFGVHGVGGIVGAVLTGLCCAPFMQGMGFEGEHTLGSQIGVQLASVGVTIAWSAVVSVIALTIAKLVCGGLRVSPEQESTGLDLAEHDERGYIL